MTRWLLLVMLLTTQLLTGRGGSVYLCIDRDGVWHIDGGPGTCACHRQKDSSGLEAQGHDDLVGNHRNHRDVATSTGSDRGILTSDEPCGCLHIPVMLSSDQPMNGVRTLNKAEVERLDASFANHLLSPGFASPSARAPSRYCSDRPAIPDFSLIVASTTIFRC